MNWELSSNLIFASELVKNLQNFFATTPSALATKVLYMYSYVGLRVGQEHAYELHV